jgi:uracil phosphoribosyltransferase
VSSITVVDHPVLAHRVAKLRDRTTDGDSFRQLVSKVVLLVPILRAGLGMVQAVQEIVPLTEVAMWGSAGTRRRCSPTSTSTTCPRTWAGGG